MKFSARVKVNGHSIREIMAHYNSVGILIQALKVIAQMSQDAASVASGRAGCTQEMGRGSRRY